MAKEKKESAFMRWYHSETGKKTVNIVYCLGASVVIIGALFKILHWPGASTVLMIGMFTEAFLFAIGTLDPPHVDYHWGKVFPQFKDAEGSQYEGSDIVGFGAPVGGGAPTSVLSDEDAKKLSDGVRCVAETAEKLAALTSVVGSVDAFKTSMDAAAAQTEKFVQAQGLLSTSSEKLSTSYNGIAADMDTVVAQTKAYVGRVETVNQNLESINGVYELQLQSVKAQKDAVDAQTATLTNQNEGLKNVVAAVEKVNTEMGQLQSLLEVSLNEGQTFNKGVQDLNAKVTNLNSIYGNMLNALN